MSLTLRCRPLVMLLSVAVMLCSARLAVAQTVDDEKPDEIIREQSIYIPYEKLRTVFEKEGRGVFLPYDKFRELWDAARDKTRPPVPQKPPVAALITEVENVATVAKDVVQVEAVLAIEVLGSGWTEVPLRLSDAAITKAELDGRPARIVSSQNGYNLLIHKEDDSPEQMELTLQYAKAIAKAPGQNSVSFQAPQAPVSRWRVTIPEGGVKVNLYPLIAATEVEVGDSTDPDAPKPGETTILAFVGATPTVRIDWTPKAEGATGLEALASVQAQQQVTISEGVIRSRAELVYTISRAELGQLAIEVPADQKVVNVFDANVRQWSVAEADGIQTITVQLFEPASGTQTVIVELEQFVDEDSGGGSLKVPVIEASAVGRQQGVVVVQVSQGLRAEATKTTDLLQIDAADLPDPLARVNWAFSYRYVAVPFELELSVEKVQPMIFVDSLVEAELTPQRLSLDVLALYTVQRAGVFRLELDVPTGYEVRRVEGRQAAGATAAQVDAYHLEGDDKTRLVVDLARKAFGRVGLDVRLERPLDQFNLTRPGLEAARIPVAVPQPAAGSVQNATGRLLIHAPESLRVNPVASEGLRSISFQEAVEGIEPQGQARGDSRPVLAFAYGQEPTSLELAVERRKPHVTVRQLLIAKIESGVVQYEATLFYEVLYSGVQSLLVDVPVEVAAGLRNETSGIREKVVDPAPDDLTAGCVRWSLAGETELLGSGLIKLVWEEKLDKLDVGKPAEVKIPRLTPIGVDRSWGQIVLAKAETIDVHAAGEPAGLRPIDPQYDLMPGAAVPGAASAFEFQDDWALTVAATRYELEEVKHTSIERAVLRMVLTRSDKITVQALYRLRSAGQRIEIKMPASSEFDIEPRLDGEPVTLEIGQADQYFVPLVDSRTDSSLLEFRYTVPNNENRLDLPEFPPETAVQKVYLGVYLPKESILLETDGPWTEEFRWILDYGLAWRPAPQRSESDLLNWVSNPISLNDSFPTGGRLYLFSALSPKPSPDGSLHLVTRDEDLVNFAILAAVFLGGLLLLPASGSTRVFMIGVLLVVLISLGVFWPILARQLIDGTLAAAISIVLVVWFVWHFIWTRPRRRKLSASEKPAQQPQSDAKAGAGAGEAIDAIPVEDEPVAEARDEEKPSGDSPDEPEDESSPDAQPKDDSDEGGKTNA